jgi:hypothetical protein
MRLYLDIDGVLTCDPRSSQGIKTVEVPDPDSGQVAEVDWDVLRIHQLLDMFDEVVWATSWILFPKMLDRLEELLGYSKRFERVGLTNLNYRRTPITCGKLNAVVDHYEASPAPFTWIDDHAGRADRKWVEREGGNLVVPNYYTGGVYRILEDLVWWDDYHKS